VHVVILPLPRKADKTKWCNLAGTILIAADFAAFLPQTRDCKIYTKNCSESREIDGAFACACRHRWVIHENFRSSLPTRKLAPLLATLTVGTKVIAAGNLLRW
jgi:hypothetical protein